MRKSIPTYLQSTHILKFFFLSLSKTNQSFEICAVFLGGKNEKKPTRPEIFHEVTPGQYLSPRIFTKSEEPKKLVVLVTTLGSLEDHVSKLAAFPLIIF
jgi:hypothetical protein